MSELTYPERLRGASLDLARGVPCAPGAWNVLRESRVIGQGSPAFAAARERVLTWQIHRAAGIRVESAAGVALGAQVRLWMGVGPIGISAQCEVVSVVDEQREAGFAYGTLPGHPECGEEAFLVRLLDDERIVGSVAAFSRPAWRGAKLAGTAATWVQRAVARRYVAGMAG